MVQEGKRESERVKNNTEKRVKEVSDVELLKVIKNFLEMGHVENIVAMFEREPRYFSWTGSILDDERFQVRLGISVLFEELQARQSEYVERAKPGLLPLLESDRAYIRGEALSVLAIIGGSDLRSHAETMLLDMDPQVQEIAADIIRALDNTLDHN